MAFKAFYNQEVIPKLREEFGFTNPNAVPTIKSIVLNVGLGSGLKDSKFIETVENTLTRISGQKPVNTKARKSIAGFKIREGNVVGMKVTLRGARMWDFLEKLIKVSLPRVRDFRGLSGQSFDGQGNYSMGLKEHIAFPEIRSDEIEQIHGIQVTISTSSENDDQARSLLTHLGLPLKKQE